MRKNKSKPTDISIFLPTSFSEDVRRQDHDRWLCSLFAPEPKRCGLHILYAFNLEIAKVREIVSEPMAGMVRLQWWREVLQDLETGNALKQHPVVEALVRLHEMTPLENKHLLHMIEGRERELDEHPLPDLEALENYTEQISSAILLLGLRLLNCQDSEIDRAVRHLGIAWGLIAVVRSAYRHFPQGQNYFPADLMQQSNLSKDDFGSEAFIDGIKPVIEALVDKAKNHLEKGQNLLKNKEKTMLKPAIPILLLSPIANAYIKTIEKRQYDVFRLHTTSSSAYKLLKLYINAFRVKI